MPDRGPQSRERQIGAVLCSSNALHRRAIEGIPRSSRGEFTSLLRQVVRCAAPRRDGHTIVERDTWTETFFPDGTARTVGNTVHIQGLGPGLVQHDAGQVIFNSDGSVAALHGPHPQFEGQTFCFALLP